MEWRDIILPSPDLIIQCNASLQGWAAMYNGTRTRDHWSVEERLWHINSLELQVGTLAVKKFPKKKRYIHILFHMDSRSVVAYVNKMGRAHSLTLSLQGCNLWQWCLQRGIHLLVEHLPGKANSTADQESKQLDAT